MSSEDEHDFCFKLGSKEELADIWPGKCVFVIQEIIHTEQTYVTDLENIVKVCVCLCVCVCVCECVSV